MATYTLHLGDCLDILPTLEPDSIDAVITDPPYGLKFMGKDWDHGVPGTAFWEAVLRVCKPGAMMLAFGGTRTHHRLMVAIEDAGWEIRDCLMWLYGSGFPKSHDIGKAIDKANGRKFEDRYALGRHIRERREACGISRETVNAWLGAATKCEHYESQSNGFARVPTLDDWRILQEGLGLSSEWLPLIERVEAERKVVGQDTKARSTNGKSALPTMGAPVEYQTWNITAPSTPAAQQWQGWDTSLKPAWEPIIMARKPLQGTVAENVLAHGCGGLNIDACRIEAAQVDDYGRSTTKANGRVSTSRHDGWKAHLHGDAPYTPNAQGRWPANLLLDEAAADALGEVSRFFYCSKASKRDRDEGLEGMPEREAHKMSGGECIAEGRTAAKGKAMARNFHPTVKPTQLMRYLVRLVTPPNGTILDPFCGSGSTGKAAMLEGFRFVGIEKEAEYLEIARRRIEAAQLPLLEIT